MADNLRLKLIVAGLAIAVLLASRVLGDESVVNSLHDLSARGPGRIRAVHETEICIFCHAPHNAAPQTPLWNRETPRRFYRISDLGREVLEAESRRLREAVRLIGAGAAARPEHP